MRTGMKDKNGEDIRYGDTVVLKMPGYEYLIQGDGWTDADYEEGYKVKGEVKFLHDMWFIDEGDGKGLPLDFDEDQTLEVIKSK